MTDVTDCHAIHNENLKYSRDDVRDRENKYQVVFFLICCHYLFYKVKQHLPATI